MHSSPGTVVSLLADWAVEIFIGSAITFYFMKTGFDWSTGAPWLLMVAMVSGIAVMTRAVRIGAAWLQTKVRHRRHAPHTIVSISHRAPKATLTFRHRGIDARYTVNALVVKTLDGTENPRPAMWRSYLNIHGHTAVTDAVLKDTEWFEIIVAQITDDRLELRYEKQGQTLVVPDQGVLIEYEVRLEPGNTRVYGYSVKRTAHGVEVVQEYTR